MCLRKYSSNNKKHKNITIMEKIVSILLILSITLMIIVNDVNAEQLVNNKSETKINNNKQNSESNLASSQSRSARQSGDYGNTNDAFFDEGLGPNVQEVQQQPNFYNYDINYHQQQQQQNDINHRKNKDNHKPAFKDCKSYNPVVKEELPPGAFVIQVKADDIDEDDIEYKFVLAPAERPRFRLDPRTGVILTQHTFDRDEPIREKEVYITVRATDNGYPKLDDVCTFKVTIEDINDNPPVFDKVKYDERISEDKKVNQIVTRITASDLDDGDNSYIEYEIIKEKDHEYFRIEKETGNLYLARPIDRRPEDSYTITVRASNVKSLEQEQETQTEVKIRVVGSSLRAPQIIQTSGDTITLKENFGEYQKKLFSLAAISNVDGKPDVVFELLNGRTEQTNSKKTFVGDQQKNDFSIMLGKQLDYETTTDYTLTVVVRNVHLLSAEYTIRVIVEDVNDNIPFFTEVTTGTVLENEPVGTQVMQVRAFDMDGTSANNIVSFELVDNKEFFKIDEQTGNITTLVEFDREERDTYNVKVTAKDNSPSALYKTGKPNQGQQVFAITIGDKNDHRPKFKHDEYIANTVSEDANKHTTVIEVKAIDIDVASQITYTITSGNIDNAFNIDNTGMIRVNNQLDYEKITNYTLRIRAFDGIYDDYATVTIKIANVNDNAPEFSQQSYSAEAEEESIKPGCIVVIQAYDPDIKDRNAPQHIKYSITKLEQQQLLDIDSRGCLSMKAPLDRDPPNGFKKWQILVEAIDEDGNGLRSLAEVIITLTDINDNAPFLSNKMPIVWYENRDPGKIVDLTAEDYDEPKNGAPFHFQLDQHGDENILSSFKITGNELHATRMFDREEQKEYFIPILIGDNGMPPMRNVSILHLIIGDENDNPMQEGSSKILVYNFKGEAPDTAIGRIYVNDPDDWDLPDKSFSWRDGRAHDNFELNTDDGTINMRYGTRGGVYVLEFVAYEQALSIPPHQVDATVEVTVREIPEEAVRKSGSIRFHGMTQEEFIMPRFDMGPSPKDRLTKHLSDVFNISTDNIDVFTVYQPDVKNPKVIDVRFSAHGSPYYEPEKLNGMVAQRQGQLESELNMKMLMIKIDECLIERNACHGGSSCSNVLQYSERTLAVYTNTTSFVGVEAYDQAICECLVEQLQTSCLNGGTPFNNGCECIDGFEGPHCELISIGFYGNGYAMYPPVSACNLTLINLEVSPVSKDGLILYIGPLSYNSILPVQDFLALELKDYFPVLIVDYGSGAVRIVHNHIQLKPGKHYMVEIKLQRTGIEMIVDNCKLSTCMSLGAPLGPNEFLNVNAPLQLGGSAGNMELLGRAYNWSHIPQNLGYTGCIRNLTVNDRTYNIGQPAYGKNIDPGCTRSMAVASTFGFDRNFLIAILVCIILLIILLLAVVVHKRHNDGWMDSKDIDDIRETIINYEDEGGGERDTDYDLNVLRGPPIYEDKPYMQDYLQKEAHEVPDIGAFLTDKKDACDKDQDAYPNDDVRYYAYEGDGNSTGSLSSLASCTDEGDLSFNYLSNFGPRFRKLADMYGEEPSDEESNVDDDGWRI